MRKNGSRNISLKQYRLTDLFLFGAILTVAYLLEFVLAKKIMNGNVPFSFVLTVPITLTVAIRWGWQSVFFAALDGVLICAFNGQGYEGYISYIAGNCLMMLVLIPIKLIGKEKIVKKWYLSLGLAAVGWVLQNLGASAAGAIFVKDFLGLLGVNFGLGLNGALSLAVAVIVVSILRRLDGLFEDQKSYLLRLDKERREKMYGDGFGDEPIEIDEETLSILNKRDNNLYK